MQGPRIPLRHNRQHPTASEQPDCVADADVFDFTGLRVLLVEDSPVNMQIATEFMQAVGVDGESADNGENALQTLEIFYNFRLSNARASWQSFRICATSSVMPLNFCSSLRRLIKCSLNAAP